MCDIKITNTYRGLTEAISYCTTTFRGKPTITEDMLSHTRRLQDLMWEEYKWMQTVANNQPKPHKSNGMNGWLWPIVYAIVMISISVYLLLTTPW